MEGGSEEAEKAEAGEESEGRGEGRREATEAIRDAPARKHCAVAAAPRRGSPKRPASRCGPSRACAGSPAAPRAGGGLSSGPLLNGDNSAPRASTNYERSGRAS